MSRRRSKNGGSPRKGRVSRAVWEQRVVELKARVRHTYGDKAAAALVRTGDGWRLDTREGQIVFYWTSTRLLAASGRERTEAVRGGGRVQQRGLIVPSNSGVEAKLVGKRLASGLGAQSAKRRQPSQPGVPTDVSDVLPRVVALLRAAGLDTTVEAGKPAAKALTRFFRRIPDYGLIYEPPGGGDIHFLPRETIVHRVTGRETTRRNLARGSKLSLRPGSPDEQRIVVARFQQLTQPSTMPRTPVAEPVNPASTTPLGREIEVQLPQWTRGDFNLLLLENGSISIRRGAGRLAVIRSNRAEGGGETIQGDFLGTDAPWASLDALLARIANPPPEDAVAAAADEPDEAPAARDVPTAWHPISAPLPDPQHPPQEARMVSSASRAPRAPESDQRHRIETTPEEATHELAELVLQASRRIRLERTAAFQHPVELRGSSFTVRFESIQGETPRLSVPFEVDLHGETASGFIWLWTSDPITLVFTQPPRKPDEVRVWAITLLGFCDLTVWPEQELLEPRRASARRARAPRARRSARGQQLPRRRVVTVRPGHVEHGLSIAALRAHMVMAHRRWLPDGWNASTEKEREAAAQGIHLEPGQTWVSAHSRGGKGGVLRLQSVSWNPPGPLARLLGS
jgi:hypothetical protein